MNNGEKRLTIGLLVSGITEQFIEYICKGVSHAAVNADVNLVVLPGKYIDRDLSSNPEIMYEYQYNTVFEFPKADNIDAIIVVADIIGCFTTKENIKKLLEKFEGIPCVLVASKMDGYVSVNYDNYNGIRQALKYLIEEAGCTRFAMIGGPNDNTDAYERKRTFFQTLREYNISYEDRNFVEGNLSRNNTEAAKKVLDDNPDVQAIFCVNDDTALSLYEEMKERKLVPGNDIYVFGYDNAAYASKLSPTLSSVWADTGELGEKALDITVRMARGEKVSSVILPTKFIKRESFGGKKDYLDVASVGVKEVVDSYFDSVFYRCRHELVEDDIQYIKKSFSKLIISMLDLANKKEEQYKQYQKIIYSTDEFLSHNTMEYADMNNLLVSFENICNYICHKRNELEYKYEYRKLFNIIYSKLIHSMNSQFGVIQEMEEHNNYAFKLFVSDIMQFEKGNDQSYMKLISGIDFLDIKNAEVFTFKEPVTRLNNEGFTRPDKIYLKAVLKEGVVESVPSIKQEVNIQEIFKNNHLDKRYTMIFFPLFSNEILYGVVLSDLTEKLYDNGEFMINQMSSAAKMIDLLKANERIQQKLEESLVTLKENNIELDNLSRYDFLTGILSRRGFFDAAQNMLNNPGKSADHMLVAYIDMNNLKIINDRYGHEEGDFSLKLIGDILSHTVDTCGVVGRIGGDEYACIMQYKKTDSGRSFVQNLYKKFDTYNHSSEKQYNITVSAGAYIIDADNKISLQEALAHADERLYEAKKKRVKTVAKSEFTE